MHPPLSPLLKNGPTEYNTPFILFSEWIALAEKHESNDYNAMTLATVSSDSQPSARIVLLKNFDEKGFVFYTNLQSRKGQELKACPKAALLFHWKSLGRQIRIEGKCIPVRENEADSYFESRPRLSQIGAWASAQSQPLENREALIARVEKLDRDYTGKAIPRPAHWSGWGLLPQTLEFWQEGKSRLHDRWRFKLSNNAWTVQRLNP